MDTKDKRPDVVKITKGSNYSPDNDWAFGNHSFMPRKLRVEYPGSIYHVMSRANGEGVVFETDVDRQDFIKTLAEASEKTGFEVHAYCLHKSQVGL